MCRINHDDNLLQTKTSTNLYLPTVWIICGFEFDCLRTHVLANDGHWCILRSRSYSGFPIIAIYSDRTHEEKILIQTDLIHNSALKIRK